MRFRNYLIQLKDRSAFYVTEEDGKMAMAAYAKGNALFVRGRMIAHALVAVIRPCNVEEDQESIEFIEREERDRKLSDGTLQLTESKTENGVQYLLNDSSTPKKLNAPM